MTELNAETVLKFFWFRRVRPMVTHELIADTDGLDTPTAKQIIGDLLTEGLLEQVGTSGLRITRAGIEQAEAGK